MLPVTVTTKAQVAMFDAVSVDVQVTVVSPTVNEVPDAGEQVTTGAASTLSVAVGVVNSTVADEPKVIADGQPVSVGAVLSSA